MKRRKARKVRRIRRNAPLSGPYYVWMTDKFMSGWGPAYGKLNKYVVKCDTLEQAECIFKNAQTREEMKSVNYGRKLPYFSESKYKVSMKTWDQLGYVWKKGCKWQNEDDYYADPRRMNSNRHRGLRGNPPREILSQKKELVRIASEVALNIINHFGPSYEGGYVGVANSTLLPVSIRRVIDTMSQPLDAPNAKKFSMYYPKYYKVPEWQKGGNTSNHIWFGQTDKGHDEVIRKGIAIAKTGNVFKNRHRGLRGNPSHSDLIDGAVDVIINTRDFCGNEKQAVRDYCFENKVSDCKELYRMAMARANSKWNAYRQEAGVKCVRRNQMRSSFDKPVFGPGRAEYKRIDTTTGAGMRLEQKMRRAGWYQAQVTPFSTVLYRKKRR